MTIVAFLIVAGVLMVEGALAVELVAPRLPAAARWMLGYPLGVFGNALLLFVLHVAQLPLSLVVVGGAHVVLLAGLIAAWWRSAARGSDGHGTVARAMDATPSHTPMRWSPLTIACVVLIALTILSAAVYALGLPTSAWDAFTNWHMRSRQFLEAHAILLEPTSKPQYPILLHMLQYVVALPAGWSDRAANAATFLLSLTTLGGIFLLLRKRRGTVFGLLFLTLVLAVPLVAVHLRQGMADLHTALFLLLAAVCFAAAEEHEERDARRVLLLSFLFAAAAAWTKLDGFYAGVLPLAVVLLLRRQWKYAAILLVLSFPWIVFVRVSGLALSPHGTSLEFHPEGVGLLFQHLFTAGSFGVHWWLVVFVGAVLLWHSRGAIFRSSLLRWALLSLLVVITTYLGTHDYQGLESAMGFARTMLTPTLLLLLALAEGVVRLTRPTGADS